LKRANDEIEEQKMQLLNLKAEFEQYQMNNTDREKASQLENQRRINRELEAEKRKLTSELNQLKESVKSSPRPTARMASSHLGEKPQLEHEFHGITKVASGSFPPKSPRNSNGVSIGKEAGLEEALSHISHLEKLLSQSERTEKLHELQAETLKNEIREMERRTKRSDADSDYLKNAVVKYMESHDHEKLFPVIASLLQFSPDEMRSIQEKHKKKGFW